MRLAPDQNPFDLKRHLTELIRHVLPILVLVAAVGLIIYLTTDGKSKATDEKDGSERRPHSHVGLLPARPLGESHPEEPGAPPSLPFDPAFVIPRPLDLARAPEAPRFDLPMGSPLGALTYNAQPFLTTRHLGDDLNGIGGWDSDRGDPVYAAGDGEVIFAGWPSDGWGNVVMILHRLGNGEEITTFYGHLETIAVPVGGLVRRGHRIGTVGKADGRYLAHLHFEVRSTASLSPGSGYGDSALGRQAGELFLARHRGAPENQQNSAIGGDWDTVLPGKAKAIPSEGPQMRIKTSSE